MAKAKSDDAPRVGNNPWDDPFVEEAIERYEALDEQCRKLMADAMRACKPLRQDQREILDEAGTRGLNKRALRAHLRGRALDRKKEALRDKLEGEDQDSYDALVHALQGLVDTPLGQAALHAAEAQGSA